MPEDIYGLLTHHFFGIFGFSVLVLVGLEFLIKHVESLAEKLHKFRVMVKSWKEPG